MHASKQQHVSFQQPLQVAIEGDDIMNWVFFGVTDSSYCESSKQKVNRLLEVCAEAAVVMQLRLLKRVRMTDVHHLHYWLLLLPLRMLSATTGSWCAATATAAATNGCSKRMLAVRNVYSTAWQLWAIPCSQCHYCPKSKVFICECVSVVLKDSVCVSAYWYRMCLW
jgi:hypothetical protein